MATCSRCMKKLWMKIHNTEVSAMNETCSTFLSRASNAMGEDMQPDPIYFRMKSQIVTHSGFIIDDKDPVQTWCLVEGIRGSYCALFNRACLSLSSLIIWRC